MFPAHPSSGRARRLFARLLLVLPLVALFASALGTPATVTLAAAAIRVADINPDAGNSSPSELVNVNGTLFFTASDGVGGVGLWKSDGSAAGTVRLAYISPGGQSSDSNDLTNVNGIVFFITNFNSSSTELWKSDGTAAGTVLVKSFPTIVENFFGFNLYFPGLANLVNVNGTLFFQANDSTNGLELWKSDGTAAGTVLVRNINPGTGGSYPYLLTDVNGTLFFGANDGSSGTELWKSDGSEAGTVRVLDIRAGAASSNLANFTNVNGTLFFAADDYSTIMAQGIRTAARAVIV